MSEPDNARRSWLKVCPRPVTNLKGEKGMTIRLFLAAIIGVGTLLVTTMKEVRAQAPAASAKIVEVKIDNFSFSPAVITVPAGTTIVWTNRDDIPHTVVSDDKVFKSKVLDTDEKFSFTFDKPGTYPYFCSVHPKMTAKVVVQ
jgi:plastocyanin